MSNNAVTFLSRRAPFLPVDSTDVSKLVRNHQAGMPGNAHLHSMKAADESIHIPVKINERSSKPLLTPERLALIKASGLSISGMLDAAGLTPHERLVCLQGILLLVLTAMPPEDRAQPPISELLL